MVDDRFCILRGKDLTRVKDAANWIADYLRDK